MLLDRLRAVICCERSAALLTVADAVLRRYHDEKARRGLLDYEDLIDKTLALLSSVDAAWVHYKLDLGIDHLLIDEAQDTSSKQWTIVRKLVAEFTAGAGARDVFRSIFAVGDEKQSIYSFQNAAPKEFADDAPLFRTRACGEPGSNSCSGPSLSIRSVPASASSPRSMWSLPISPAASHRTATVFRRISPCPMQPPGDGRDLGADRT